MPGAKIFILPEELERWMDAAGVSVDNDLISLPDIPDSFVLSPVVHVTRLVAGDEDAAELEGKILPVSSLEMEGLEYFQNSLIAGDNAYEAVEGFMVSYDANRARKEAAPPAGPPAGAESAAPERGAEPPASEAQKPAEESQSPEDMLARLILDKLK
jgi:hypothetical protein